MLQVFVLTSNFLSCMTDVLSLFFSQRTRKRTQTSSSCEYKDKMREETELKTTCCVEQSIKHVVFVEY